MPPKQSTIVVKQTRKHMIPPSTRMLLALAIAASARFAQGETLSVGGTATADVPSAVSVAVQQFDPALGTLTGVTLSLVDASVSTELSLFNAQPDPEIWTVNMNNGFIVFQGGGAGTTVSWDNTVGPEVTYSVTVPVAPSGFTIANPATPTGSSSQTYGGLASFIGLGTVSGMSVDFYGSWGAEGLGRGDTFGVNEFSATANWMVTYGYIPIPEPTTLSLLLVGAVALGLRRRSVAAA